MKRLVSLILLLLGFGMISKSQSDEMIMRIYESSFTTYFGVTSPNQSWGFDKIRKKTRVLVEDFVIGSSSEFDFNDLVFDVEFETASKAKITIQAVGTTLPIEAAGKEAHEIMGYSTNMLINTSGFTSVNPVSFIVEGDFGGKAINIPVRVKRGDYWVNSIAEIGTPASKIAVPTDFVWSKERDCIGRTYPAFYDWVSGGEVFYNDTYENFYNLQYKINDEVYCTYKVEYGAPIPQEIPVREGYAFLGWGDTPETMPAHDVMVTGSFKQIVFEVKDVKYEITGEETVTIKSGNCKGNVDLATNVVINGQNYIVTAIAENAFKGNTQIASVSIPAGIKSIGDNAFSGCVALFNIDIGKDVVSIGSKAFANVGTQAADRTRTENPFTVNCYAESVPQTAADSFEDSPIATGSLLVNDNIVDAYKTTSPWSGFGKIQGFHEVAGINDITIDSPNSRIYDMQGDRLDNLQKGVNIIKAESGSVKKIIVK
jgi:hypothetical protein